MTPEQERAALAEGKALEKVRAEAKAESLRQRLAMAREARALKFRERQLIREKMASGMPITPEEAAKLVVPGKNGTKAQERRRRELLNAVAPTLVIKPRSINELRLLIEDTAQKRGYNPVEALIDICEEKDEDGKFVLDAKERINIHRTLLPFLMPQIAPAKPDQVDKGSDDGQLKIKVVQMTFPPDSGAPPPRASEPATSTT